VEKINKIGVIGAGNMGSGIVQKIAQEGINVTMVDISDENVQRGLEMIKDVLKEAVERQIFSQEEGNEILSRITGTSNLKDVADADIVIEAVFEDIQVKSDLFMQLDDICGPKTILATNTSGFYVHELAKSTQRPDRFIGMHYFYHPAKNRLLEVIPHDGTSPETIEKTLLSARLHGKTPIVVKDAPGFAVNRFFVPFLMEGIHILEEGIANIPTIDEAAKRAFEIGMGPFLLMNETGIPIAFHTATTLGKELGSFYNPPEILKVQMDKKQDWDLSGDVDESIIESLIDRFYGVTLGIAAELVDDGVASIEDTDRGAKVGLRWNQGPFEIMNEIGIDKTCKVVAETADRYPGFKVPTLLTRQKERGRPFVFNLVDLDVSDGIATITINRPEAMNALNETVVNQLENRFDAALSDDDVTAIVFQGAGKAFVAGADINYFIQNIENKNLQKTIDFTRKGHEVLLKIENSPKLTIALLDGLSLGGGSELAFACQAIVATSAGSFGFPETGIGIYPGLGGMIRLSRQVGPELAKYYILTGAIMSAGDAYDLGIVSRLVDVSEVEDAIHSVINEGKQDKYAPRQIPDRFKEPAGLCTSENLQKILKGVAPEDVNPSLAARTIKTVGYKAPLALKAVNEIIDRQMNQSMEDAIETELGRLMDIFSTADAYAGLSARGRPEFKGK